MKCFIINYDECFKTLKPTRTHVLHAVGKLYDVFVLGISLFTKPKHISVLFCFLLFWDRIFWLYSPGWSNPERNPPASAFWALVSKVCAIVPSFSPSESFLCLLHLNDVVLLAPLPGHLQMCPSVYTCLSVSWDLRTCLSVSPDRVLPCNPGWPGTQSLQASASWMLGLIGLHLTWALILWSEGGKTLLSVLSFIELPLAD